MTVKVEDTADETEAMRAGAAHQIARRRENERIARADEPSTDAEGLVEFGCECTNSECERSVKVPLYVYRRIVESGDQYLVQAAHHAYARHRTIVTLGLMRIEEPA
jgi:hypothetical protein